MRRLTIRNVPEDVAVALDAEKRRRGTSLNRTARSSAITSLRVEEQEPRRSNGLEKFGGNWTQEEFEEFEAAIAWSAEIDPEMWK